MIGNDQIGAVRTFCQTVLFQNFLDNHFGRFLLGCVPIVRLILPINFELSHVCDWLITFREKS